MGFAVFFGMIGIFLTPVSYVLLRHFIGNRPLKQHDVANEIAALLSHVPEKQLLETA